MVGTPGGPESARRASDVVDRINDRTNGTCSSCRQGHDIVWIAPISPKVREFDDKGTSASWQGGSALSPTSRYTPAVELSRVPAGSARLALVDRNRLAIDL